MALQKSWSIDDPTDRLHVGKLPDVRIIITQNKHYSGVCILIVLVLIRFK